MTGTRVNLYQVIKSACESTKEKDAEKAIDDTLYSIIQCEMMASSAVIIISPRKRRGFFFKTLLTEDGLSILSIHSVSIENLGEPWEKISSITSSCRDIRVVKQGDFALVICNEEIRKQTGWFEKELCRLLLSPDTIVYCLHEDGEAA